MARDRIQFLKFRNSFYHSWRERTFLTERMWFLHRKRCYHSEREDIDIIIVPSAEMRSLERG